MGPLTAVREFFRGIDGWVQSVVDKGRGPRGQSIETTKADIDVSSVCPLSGCTCGGSPRTWVPDGGDGRDANGPDDRPDGPPPVRPDGGDGGPDRRVDAGDGGPPPGDDGGDGGPVRDGGDGGPPRCPDGSARDAVCSPCDHTDWEDGIRDPCNHNDALRSGYADRPAGIPDASASRVQHFLVQDDLVTGAPWTSAPDIVVDGRELFVLSTTGGGTPRNSILMYNICEAARTLNQQRRVELPSTFNSQNLFPQQMSLPGNESNIVHITAESADLRSDIIVELDLPSSALLSVPFARMGLAGVEGEPSTPPNTPTGLLVAGGRLFAALGMRDLSFNYRDGKVLVCPLVAVGDAAGRIAGTTVGEAPGVKRALGCRYVGGALGQYPAGLTLSPDGNEIFSVQVGTDFMPPIDPTSEVRLARIDLASERVEETVRVARGSAAVLGRVARLDRMGGVDGQGLVVLPSGDSSGRIFFQRYDDFSRPPEERTLFDPATLVLFTGVQTVVRSEGSAFIFVSNFFDGRHYVRSIYDPSYRDEIDLGARGQLGPSWLITREEAEAACGVPVFDKRWVIISVVAGGLVLLEPLEGE